jgi:hypothetical protein
MDAKSNENQAELIKLSTNFHSLPFATALFAFCVRERGGDPKFEASHVTWTASAPAFSLFPLYLPMLPEPARAFYSARCVDVYGGGVTVRYSDVLAGSLPLESSGLREQLAPAHLDLLIAQMAWGDGDFRRALSSLDLLLAEGNPYFRHKAIRMRSRILLDLGNVEECIDYITSMYVAEPELGSILPVAKAVACIDAATERRLQGNLSLPILYDVHARDVGEDVGGARQFAFEDFLAAQGVSIPSQLRAHVDRFERRKLVYYLRNICVAQVMDISTAFRRSLDLEEERTAICQLLVELDPPRKADYQMEITDIARNQVIKRRLKEIEQSKIYVDVESIRKIADQSLRETFNRYQALPTAADQAVEQVMEALRKAASQPGTVLALTLPTNERNAVLANIVSDIRDLFVSSSEHGLDGYLSVRVRHGTLAGQIRSALEGAQLLTQRERTSRDYRLNTYWSARILDLEARNNVAKRLARFSADFDGLIETIKNEWIQVRTTDKAKGEFDFRLTDNQLGLIAASVREDTSFEAFLDVVLATLWQRLDLCLASIRERLSVDAKAMLDGLLGSLQIGLRKAAGAEDITDLENAIIATRTELTNILNRIAQWFRLPKQTSTTPFPIADAVSIAVESVRRFHPQFFFRPQVTVSGETALPGLLLPGLVDVFIIIFENIVRHSETHGPPDVQVHISSDADWINFVVENQIGPGVYSEDVVRHVVDLKQAVEKGGYRKSVAAEGGTGFHKIWKIIAHDIGGECTLDFGFRSGDRFFVEIGMRRVV